MDGGSQTTTTPPTEMDLLNSKVIAQLAPMLFQQMAPGLAKTGTSEGAGTKAQMVGKGVGGASQQALAPGTSQMFSMVDAMGKPGSTKNAADMMLLMYGKQPQQTPAGGSTTVTPGLMDYTNMAANIAGLYPKFKQPNFSNSPTNNYPTPTGGYGGMYNTGYSSF